MPVGGAAFGGLGKAGFAGLVLALLLLVSLLVYVLLFHRPAEWMPPRIPYAKLHLGRHPELLGNSRTGRVLKGRYRGSAVVSECKVIFACCLEAASGAYLCGRHAKCRDLPPGRWGQRLSALQWCKVALAATPPAATTRLLLCQAWSCKQQQSSEQHSTSLAAGLQAVKRMLPPADPLKASPFNLDAPELLRLQSQVLDRALMEQRSTLEDRWVSAIRFVGHTVASPTERL